MQRTLGSVGGDDVPFNQYPLRIGRTVLPVAALDCGQQPALDALCDRCRAILSLAVGMSLRISLINKGYWPIP